MVPARHARPAAGRLLGVKGAAIVLLVVVVGLMWPALAQAQTPATIERLQIDLWPDYDRQAVLVIYWIQLPETTPLPATVAVPIPAEVGNPFAVGMGGAQGQPMQASYERLVDGEWATIWVTTNSLDAQVEYYADLAVSGDRRSFAFTWPGGFSLGNLSYEVQQPFGASDMQITPPGSPQTREDGLVYYSLDLGPQAAEATVTIEVEYRKVTPGLSIDALRPTGPLEAPSSEEGWLAGIADRLPWFLGGFAALLLAGGAVWYWRPGAAAAPARPRRRRPPKHAEGEVSEIDASPAFCRKCGAQAGASDRFCRRCGTRLRQ